MKEIYEARQQLIQAVFEKCEAIRWGKPEPDPEVLWGRIYALEMAVYETMRALLDDGRWPPESPLPGGDA